MFRAMKTDKKNKKRSKMTTRYYSDEMVKKLTSLGCAFNVKAPVSPADPELCIIKSLRFYWEYNDIFFMIYSLLKNRIGSLIHVERLISLTKRSGINVDEKILLIALCNKLAEQGEPRFDLVFRQLYKKGLKMHAPPESECSAHLIKTVGRELCLSPFGVKVRAFYEVSEKKLFTLKHICRKNAWIKHRALTGPNYKTDILYLKSTGVAKTAYQSAKIAGCSVSTATRIWKSLGPVPHLKKLTG